MTGDNIIMANEALKTAFLLNQKVDLTYQESDQTPPIKEAYVRKGIILVKTDSCEEIWQRSIEEFIVGDEFLLNAKGKIIHKLENLRESHEKNMDSRNNEFGLSNQIDLQSNYPENTNLLVLPGYPLRFDLIYLPSVMQFLPKDKKAIRQGEAWESQIRIKAGAGRLTLNTKVKCLANEGDELKMSVEISDQPIIEEINIFTLTILPKGLFEVSLNKKDMLPENVKGDYSYSIRAKGPNLDDIIGDVEVVNYKVQYILNRIQVKADDNKIGPWNDAVNKKWLIQQNLND